MYPTTPDVRSDIIEGGECHGIHQQLEAMRGQKLRDGNEANSRRRRAGTMWHLRRERRA